MSSTAKHRERQQRQLQKHYNNINNTEQSLHLPHATPSPIDPTAAMIYTPLNNAILSQSQQPDINDPTYVQNYIHSIIHRRQTALHNIQSKLLYRTVQLSHTNQHIIARKQNILSNTMLQHQKHVNKLKSLSNKQCKQLGLYSIKPAVKHQYNDYLPMNQLWNQYVNHVLYSNKSHSNTNNYSKQQKQSNIHHSSNRLKQQQSATTNNNNNSTADTDTDTTTIPSSSPQHKQSRSTSFDPNKLLTLDYNGCMMSVVQSSNPTLIGITGICIHESQYMIRLITSSNTVKSIHKYNTVFQCDILQHKYLLYGNQFICRSIERSIKKWKYKPTVEF